MHRRSENARPIRALNCRIAVALTVLMSAASLYAFTRATFSEQDAPPPVVQQDTPPQDSEINGTELLEAIQNRIQQLEQVTDRSDVQNRELAHSQQARDSLNRLQRSRENTARLLDDAARAPTDLATLREQPRPQILDTLPDEIRALPIAELRQRLDAARSDLQRLRQERDDLNATSSRRDERLRVIPGEIEAARRRISEIDSALAAAAPIDDPATLTLARNQSLRSERQLLQQQVSEFEQERVTYNTRREVLRDRILLKEQQLLAQERLVPLLEAEVTRKQQQIAEQERAESERRAAQARFAHSVVRSILEENERYAASRADILERKAALTPDRNKTEEVLTSLRARLRADRERIEEVGLSEAIGMRLRTQRDRLPNYGQLRKRLTTHELELNRAQLERGRLEDLQLRLVDIDGEIDQRFAESSDAIPAAGAARDALRDTVRQALQEQNEDRLSRLIEEYDSYINTVLVPLLERETNLLALTSEYRDFIRAHILWIQSTQPIGNADFDGLRRSIIWLTNGDSWMEILAALWANGRQRPVGIILGLLVFLSLLLTRSLMIAFIERAAQRAGRITTNFVGDTLTVAALTVLLALHWPLLAWLLAWRTGQIADSIAFADHVSNGLTRLAYVMFVLLLFKQLCRRNGLADAHFRWRPRTLRMLRRNLHWFAPAILPLAFLTGLTTGIGVEVYRNSLGRLGFIASTMLIAVLTMVILHPKRGVPDKYIEDHPNGWTARLRWVWFPMLVLAPLALGVAAGMGYLYTALELRERFAVSVQLVIVLIIANALMLRWIFLTQRRLAYEQAKRKRDAQLKALRKQPSDSGSPSKADTTADEQLRARIVREEEADQIIELDVDSITTQSRQLLRSVIGFSLVIGLALIWANVVPALNILEQVTLWNVTATTTAPDGIQVIETQEPITLKELAVALVILVVTVIVGRNMPGLLEIIVLQRLPFTPSGRYAIRTITQYVLVIIGVVVSFDAIGIGWSNVQFLAAAITVGLGFGLQEIFANFVSGIIILFERPIRVGDVITVGGISGTVARIRMRATTITDWDRKELIIPNKEFVTGQIINWSLTDSILRVVIPVGVSYSADTDLARDLLMQVASESTHVLKDPPARAVFLGFGDSTLNFELRIFIGSIDHFINVRDSMHHAIIKRFRAHDVEIAFPQRDLHIRSVAPELTLMPRQAAQQDATTIRDAPADQSASSFASPPVPPEGGDTAR